MKIGTRYSLLSFLMISATAGVLGQAADSKVITETLSQTAERFGLWAALVLVLVAAALWYAYSQACFVQNTLVELVRQNQRVMDKVCDAIRNAPCGAGLHDSDGVDDPDITPTRALAAVERRRVRQQKRDANP